MTTRCLVLRNAAQVRERFFLPFHFEKRNGTGLRTSSLRSKRNDGKVPAAWVCSVSFVPGFFRSEFYPSGHAKSFPAFCFLKESKVIWQLRNKVCATPETSLGA